MINLQTELSTKLESLNARVEEQDQQLESERTRAGRLDVELADALAAARQAAIDIERLNTAERQTRANADALTMRAEAAEKELESERTTSALLRAKIGTDDADRSIEGVDENAQRHAEVERLQSELERLRERFNELIAQEEARRTNDVEAQRREYAELSERMLKQMAQHDVERLRLKRQHEENELAMEEKYNKKLNLLEHEVGDLKMASEQLREENARLEQDL